MPTQAGRALISRQQHVFIVKGDGMHGNRLDDAGLQGCPQTLSVRSSTQGWTNAAAGIGAGEFAAIHKQMPPTDTGLEPMVGSAENVHSGSGGEVHQPQLPFRMTLLQGQQLLNGQQFAHQRVRSPARPQGGDPFSGHPVSLEDRVPGGHQHRT